MGDEEGRAEAAQNLLQEQRPPARDTWVPPSSHQKGPVCKKLSASPPPTPTPTLQLKGSALMGGGSRWLRQVTQAFQRSQREAFRTAGAFLQQ